MEVTVDAQKIRSIHLENLSESTAAMFPLVEPTLEELSSQIYSGQSLDELKYSSDQKYTSLMLIKAIDEAVSKAELKKSKTDKNAHYRFSFDNGHSFCINQN